MTSDSEEQTTRKRPRTSATGESKQSKKQRGRPKVDTQDETAADRRRTQIRLAQRAYRQRKETTISSLQKQVEQLQSIIDSMNSSFLYFNDRVLQSDVLSFRPQIASELKETTEKFVSLTRNAKKVTSAENDEYTSESPVSASVPSQNSQNSSLPTTLSSRDYNDVMQIDPSPAQAQQPPGTHMGLGYWRIFDDTDGTAEGGLDNSYYPGVGIPQMTSTSTTLASMDNPITDPSQFNSSNFAAYPYRGLPGAGGDSTMMNATTSGHTSTVPAFDNSGNFSFDPHQQQTQDSSNSSSDALIATPYASSPIFQPIPFFSGTLKSPTISAPFTYSFQETTFARRLQRASIERTFHLLSGAYLQPSAFSRVFRICRHYFTREELVAQFKSLLQQSVMEPLEFLKSPFLHLGGAGTHYPSRSSDGAIAPIRNTQGKYFSHNGSKTIRRVGPYATKAQLARALSGSEDPDRWTPILEEDLRNYEGEWFDSQDVEGYLAEMGVYINPQASFAEATITQILDVVAKGAHPDSEASLEMENLMNLQQGMVNHLPGGSNSNIPSSGRGYIIDPEARNPYMGNTGGTGSGVDTLSQVLTAPSPAGQSSRSGSGSGDVSAGVPTTPSTTHMQMQNAMLDPFPVAMFGSNNTGDHGLNAGMTNSMLMDIPPTHYDFWSQSYGVDIESLGDGWGGGVVTGVEGTRLRRKVTIDVQRLVNGLIKRSVCIGRGPGFRREDVDYALKQAIIEAF